MNRRLLVEAPIPPPPPFTGATLGSHREKDTNISTTRMGAKTRIISRQRISTLNTAVLRDNTMDESVLHTPGSRSSSSSSYDSERDLEGNETSTYDFNNKSNSNLQYDDPREETLQDEPHSTMHYETLRLRYLSEVVEEEEDENDVGSLNGIENGHMDNNRGRGKGGSNEGRQVRGYDELEPDDYWGCNRSEDSEDSSSSRSLGDCVTIPTHATIDEPRQLKGRKSARCRSDSELDSVSVHKRALHEAESTVSVLRRGSDNHSVNHEYRLRSGQAGMPSVSSFLENGENHHATSDASTIMKSMVPDSSEQAIHASTPPPSKDLGLKWASGFASLKPKSHSGRRHPLFLLLVIGISTMGVSLYTKSYATLSITLEEVVSTTTVRRRQVAVHFQSIEEKIYDLQSQLIDLDSESLLLHPASSNDEAEDSRILREEPNTSRGGEDKLMPSHRGRSRREHFETGESGLFDEMVAVKEEIRVQESKMTSLEKYFQETSFRDAMRKYGNGVIRVQLDLEFPIDKAQKNEKGVPGSSSEPGSIKQNNILILEMAPLELMPYSVFTFLEMVDAKLFDGCSFILNAMNVIKAAPLPYDGSSASQKVKAFTKLGLDSVAFREYSSDYPHEQFTVGFATDGSPSFFINTDDNTEQHIGEPCFAKVVSGFDTVERLEDAPKRNGMWYRKRIGIRRARIL